MRVSTHGRLAEPNLASGARQLPRTSLEGTSVNAADPLTSYPLPVEGTSDEPLSGGPWLPRAGLVGLIGHGPATVTSA